MDKIIYKIIQTERGHIIVEENELQETIKQAKEAGCLRVEVRKENYYMVPSSLPAVYKELK